MIDLRPADLNLVLELVKKHFPECGLWAFGSRISGKARKFSDLDIVLVGKERLDISRIFALKEDLSESDLPISVDVLDYNSISEDFRKIIDEKHEVLI